MAAPPNEALLPVLMADLADDESRDVLEAAAANGGRVYVPLENSPVSSAQHVLEVHIPSAREPLRFLAEPLGPPTADGFPLRIKTLPNMRARAKPPPVPVIKHKEGASPPPLPVAPPGPASGIVRGKRAPTSMALSASHTKDLPVVGPLPESDEPDADADKLVGRALAGGKLLIEQLIGRGGVGAVYKARHRELRMPVAVKVLHESFQHDIDFCRKFYAEALAASRLDHPNITRVIDFGQEPDGLLYLAMEFLDGVELRAVIEKEGTVGATRIAEVMMQVCAGLSHAHARGIVHRDIKPENLVLVAGQDDDGKTIEIVKVCDFGIAQQRALPSTTDETGVIAGTPEYMSPEQCRADELDARSDIYACGIVIYEMMTGNVPFTAERPQSILNKQQFVPPQPPSKSNPRVDLSLERVVMKALQKEAAQRQQSMRELRTELRELLSDEASPMSARNVGPDPSGATAHSSTRRKAEDSSVSRDLQATTGTHATLPKAAAPAWLERGPVYGNAFQSSPGSGNGPAAAAASPAVAQLQELAAQVIGYLQQMPRISDPRGFAQVASVIEPALRPLAAAGDVRTLWAVASTMNAIAMESTPTTGSRAATAAKVLRVFEDPQMLAGVAEQAIAGPEETREHARRLLVQGGVAGAYGLYGARVKLAKDAAVRGPFVNVLKDFGGKAWPVVRAALEKIIASADANAPTMELAEDLLLVLPLVGDESAGHLAVKYLRVDVSGVCRAATAAVVKLWGERSQALLVGMLQTKSDVVRIAAIAGLRQLGGIDEHIVPRLQPILERKIEAGEELRAAAAVALSHATPGAQKAAISILSAAVTPQRERPVPARNAQAPQSGGALSREDFVAIAIARSLLHVGGKNYRGLIAERAERSGEPLKSELRKLLAT